MRRTCLVTLPLLLAACGSDGDSGGGVTAAAAALAAAAPTTTPASTTPATTAPASDYPAYAQLTGTTALPTAQTGYFTRNTPPQFLGFRGFGEGPAISYDAAARSYTVSVGTGTDSFVAGEIDASAPAGTLRYVKANRHSFTLTQPSAGGRSFDYVRFARLVSEFSPGQADSAPLTATFLTGVATRGADVPTSGSASFARTVITGEAYVTANGTTTAYALDRSTFTVTVDYAAGRITARITLVGVPTGGGAAVTLSTLNVVSDFAGASTFKVAGGDFTPAAPSALAGALFGPRGAEAGLLLYLQGRSQAGSSLTLVAAGAAGN